MSLSLVPTDDLITEIFNRYENILISGTKHSSDNDFIQLRRCQGNRYNLIAQIEVLKHKIIEAEIESQVLLKDNLDR